VYCQNKKKNQNLTNFWTKNNSVFKIVRFQMFTLPFLVLCFLSKKKKELKTFEKLLKFSPTLDHSPINQYLW